MAETRTARAGLPTYSDATTDSFSMADWNETVADIDAAILIHLPAGTLAARPAFGVAGRVYRATDVDGGAALFYDTGAAWLRVNPATAVGGAAPTASALGDAAAEGAATAAARADHRHAREAFGNVTAQTAPGLAAANGTAATVSRSDHAHGTPATGSPVASNPGDAAADGAAGTVARADHRHAREGYAALAGIGTLAAGGGGGAGVNNQLARGDHVHPLPAAPPGASALGDAAAEGASAAVARADHRHGRETAAAVRDAILPAGLIGPYAGGVAPPGWLVCDGSIVAQATYPALFAVIGHTYGGDPGAGNFRLPDYRDRVPLGAGATYTRGTPIGFGGHSHGVTGGVAATGAIATAGHNNDHAHDYGDRIAAGYSTGDSNANHTHDYPDFGGTDGGVTRTTTGQSVGHGHPFGGRTAGATANHGHDYNHGHGHNLGTAAANIGATGLPSTYIIKAH